MKRLKEILKSYTKKLFSDWHSAIIALIVTSLFLGTGAVYIFFQTLWLAIINTILLPTPLWASLAWGLLLLIYVYLKTPKKHSLYHPQSESFLIEDNDVKWKVTHKNNGSFTVDDNPYCKYHDTRYIQTAGGQYMCPDVIGSKCKSRIVNDDEIELLHKLAKSKAEKHINQYETKC